MFYVCNVPGCGKKKRTRGYCTGHYSQVWIHGRITKEKIGYFPPKKCSVEGCDHKAESLGYCVGHYTQFRKHGKITHILIGQRKIAEKCSVEGCAHAKEGRKDYCTTHFRQIKKCGHIVNASIKTRDKTRGCKVEGCNGGHCAKGYCGRHYGQFLKYGEIKYINRVNAKSTGIKMRSGYMYVLKPDHPRADKRGYVKKSWLVWENNTGHVVTPPEVIHHINRIKTDDRFENLMLLPNKSAHTKEHGGRLGGVRVVTKDMAKAEMIRVSNLINGHLTTRAFEKLSTISSHTIKCKYGWNSLKEELCIK